MRFVNPFDLIDIDGSGVPSSNEIRKSKRKGLLKFKLADGNSIMVDGRSIQRSDFLRAADDLADEQVREFYFLLHKKHPKLNRFLLHGDVNFFIDYDHESLFEYQPFVEFVSPYFAYQYDQLLKSALEDRDQSLVSLLSSRHLMVTPGDRPALYREAEQHIERLVEDMNEIKNRLDGAEQASPGAVRSEMSGSIPVDLLNALPSDLRGGRDQLATALRNLSVAIFNELDDVQLARDSIRAAGMLDTSEVTARKIEGDVQQIEEIYEERQLRDRHSDELDQCADAIIQLHGLVNKVDGQKVDPQEVWKEAESAVNLKLLNGLPDELIDIRNQTAIALRGLATGLWNDRQDAQAAEAAVAITELALQLRTEGTIRSKLKDDLATINELGQEAREAELALIRKLADDVGGMRSQLEAASGLFSGSTVNWRAVNSAVTSTFTKDLVQLLEQASDTAPRRRLFKDLKYILSSLRSNGYDGQGKARLYELVSSGSWNDGSSSQRSSRKSDRSSVKAKSRSKDSSSRRAKRSSDSGFDSNVGCMIAFVIIFVLIMLANL